MSSCTEVSFATLQSLANVSLQMLPKQAQSTRSQILNLSVVVGKLSGLFMAHPPIERTQSYQGQGNVPGFTADTPSSFVAHPLLQSAMGNILWALCQTGSSCDLDLRCCVLKKVQLNARKYPVDLCKGKAGKYTKYSKETGITKERGQSTIEEGIQNDQMQSITEISDMINNFSTERLWDQYHTPRNLVLALIGELGELSELFQWKGDGECHLTNEELDSVGQELADITIYLLRLAYVCSSQIEELTMKIANEAIVKR